MATDSLLERKRIVGEYVRDRLIRECEGAWGKAFEISKKIGFSPAHVSNVKDGHRNVGNSFAMAMAEYWGMTYSKLEQVALTESHTPVPRPQPKAQVEPADDHPSLTATLAYCQGDLYPATFLQQYERKARKLPHDRPRDVWLADIEVQYWEWRRQEKAKEDSGMTSAAERSGVRATKTSASTRRSAKTG